MRVKYHIHIRHIILYHYEKGWKVAHSFRDLIELLAKDNVGCGFLASNQVISA